MFIKLTTKVVHMHSFYLKLKKMPREDTYWQYETHYKINLSILYDTYEYTVQYGEKHSRRDKCDMNEVAVDWKIKKKIWFKVISILVSWLH